MKKILLTLGTFGIIVAPVVTVISCSTESKETTTKDTTKKETKTQPNNKPSTNKEEYKSPTFTEMNLWEGTMKDYIQYDKLKKILKKDPNNEDKKNALDSATQYKRSKAWNEILDIPETITKEAAINKIKEILKDDALHLDLYVKFIEHQDSWKTAFYLFRLMDTFQNPHKTAVAKMALKDAERNPLKEGETVDEKKKREQQENKDLVSKLIGTDKSMFANIDSMTLDEFQDARLLYMLNKFSTGVLTPDSIIDSIMKIISGKGDFSVSLLGLFVTIETKSDDSIIFKPVTTGLLSWAMLAPLMGGDTTLEYIVSKASGYSIEYPDTYTKTEYKKD